MPDSASSRFMTLCLACGQPLNNTAQICAKCVKNTSPYAQLVVPFRYSFPVDRLIADLKYGGKLSYGRVLGVLLAMEAKRRVAVLPDVLIPMPMHKLRYRQRGFNQSVELAHWCADSLGLTMRTNWVDRHIDTPSLAGLTKASRELEIRGAFTAKSVVRGQHIAIVDDVLTTGASSAELARELYDSGAARVSLWVVARTATSTGNPIEFVNRQLHAEAEALSALRD
jgi:ComF family protein